jgi:hypothetical protein
MWFLYFIVLFTVIYFATHPQYLMLLLFHFFKFAFIVQQKISTCWSKVSLWKRNAKRKILLKTKTFDDRPVMKPPSLINLPRKKF